MGCGSTRETKSTNAKSSTSETVKGDSGSRVSFQRVAQFKDAVFFGNSSAWVVTAKDGDLFHTSDAGVNWRKVALPSVMRVSGISFINEQVGWVLGLDTDSINQPEGGDYRLWRTSDGGATWTIANFVDSRLTVGPDNPPFRFVNNSDGWVVGAFGIFFTQDAGATWHDASLFSPQMQKISFNGEGLPGTRMIRETKSNWVATIRWELFRTTDNGRSWVAFKTPPNVKPSDVYLVDDHTVLLSDTKPGILHRTNDAGTTWDLISLGVQNLEVRSVFFVNQTDGWVVGNLLDTEEAVVLHTSDGGQKWKLVQVGEQNPFYSRVFFTDASHGWIFGRDKIYYTDNGGTRWRECLKLDPVN